MNYIIIENEFLREYPDYKNDIQNFTEYLARQWKNSLEDESIRFMIQGLDVEFLLKSLIYNVEETKKYKKKTAAKRYATVIGQYFNYIRKSTNIENPTLFNAISYNRSRENAYMKRMMEYIESCSMLDGIVEQEPLAASQVEIILKWADEQLEEKDWKNSTNFRKAIAAIALKMMLLYGITYRELRKIQWKSYDDMYGYIMINGFHLRLPVKLSVQLKRMKTFIENQKIRNEQGMMFTDYSGKQWLDITSSSGIPDYLGVLLGITSVTSVVKYGIGQLLKAGLSDSVIKKITGASDKLVQGCVLQDDDELIQIINNKIVTVDLYYKF